MKKLTLIWVALALLVPAPSALAVPEHLPPEPPEEEKPCVPAPWGCKDEEPPRCWFKPSECAEPEPLPEVPTPEVPAPEAAPIYVPAPVPVESSPAARAPKRHCRPRHHRHHPPGKRTRPGCDSVRPARGRATRSGGS